MVRLMVGREMSNFYQRHRCEPGEELLSVKELRTTVHADHALAFSLRAGEIVGVAGLVGAGRTEMLQALSGVVPAKSGQMKLMNQDYLPRHPRDAIERGVMLVPEDRKQHGLVMDFSVGDNLALPSLQILSRWGFRDSTLEAALADKQSQNLQIKASHQGQAVRLLSGGNQQKVVIGKWLACKPAVLLLDEPTRGIDVGAKREIYQWMESLAASGMAVLFVSSDLEEILGLADRVLVMHEGRISGELSHEQMSEEAIMRFATGVHPQ
jgi:ribose transport system ATP-binding protein